MGTAKCLIFRDTQGVETPLTRYIWIQNNNAVALNGATENRYQGLMRFGCSNLIPDEVKPEPVEGHLPCEDQHQHDLQPQAQARLPAPQACGWANWNFPAVPGTGAPVFDTPDKPKANYNGTKFDFSSNTGQKRGNESESESEVSEEE